MFRIWPWLGDTRCADNCLIARGDFATSLVPAADVLEFDAENRTLKPIHAGVPAQLLVMVAAAHAVLAQRAEALGNLVAAGGHHAGVAGGAEFLGGVKTESRGIAKRPCLRAAPFRIPGLGGIFDEKQTALASQVRKHVPIGALTIEVNGKNGAYRSSAMVFERGFDGNGIKIKCDWIDVSQHRRCTRAEDGAD